jgi:hypothetical protein
MIIQYADQTQAGRAQADDWTITIVEWTGDGSVSDGL